MSQQQKPRSCCITSCSAIEGQAPVTGVAWANVEQAQRRPLNHEGIGHVGASDGANLATEPAVDFSAFRSRNWNLRQLDILQSLSNVAPTPGFNPLRKIDDGLRHGIYYYYITSVIHLESRTILRSCLAVIVNTGRGDVRVPKPLLDLGDVGLMVERIGGGRRP